MSAYIGLHFWFIKNNMLKFLKAQDEKFTKIDWYTYRKLYIVTIKNSKVIK